MNQNKKR